MALDDALEALAGVDERKARVIELRFFGGLSVEESAAVLKVSVDTVMRDWKLAKAWYSDPRSPSWRLRTREESQAVIKSAGLVGDFWELPR